MNRTFQSRMGKFQDRLRRKLLDNQISLTGQSADTIRVRLKYTKATDIDTRIVESVDVVPVIFPPLVDVPYRRLTGNENVAGEGPNTKIKLETALSATELFPIEIMTAQADKINTGDFIFRVIMEETFTYPLVMVLEVVDPKGTFGTHSMIYSKYECVYYNDELPQEVMDFVAATARRRLHVEW